MKKESGRKKADQFWEIYMWERENFVFDSLIYLEPVERLKNRSNVMKSRSFGDSTSSRVTDKLKTIRLCWNSATVQWLRNAQYSVDKDCVILNISQQTYQEQVEIKIHLSFMRWIIINSYSNSYVMCLQYT